MEKAKYTDIEGKVFTVVSDEKLLFVKIYNNIKYPTRSDQSSM